MLQKNYPIRTRFAKDIVAEVFFPERQEGRVVIFCSGAPGLSSKRELFQFLSDKGYTSIHPRYRGTWESDGEFLKRSPHQDILDVIDELIQKKKIFSFSHK
ncbi:MAG: alpha/beta hydrolase, partial [Candidatus Moraniibacteriota bacterium]